MTTAPANLDGSARYFVYLVVTPTSTGLLGYRSAFAYRVDTPENRGLKVESWHSCNSGYTYADKDAWPAPGIQLDLTWTECEMTPFVTAGYFYVTAYAPAVMTIIGDPLFNRIGVSGCSGGVQDVDPDRVGWVSFGGAPLGTDTNGCNPALEPCATPTPVRPTTWGKLKMHFKNGG